MKQINRIKKMFSVLCGLLLLVSVWGIVSFGHSLDNPTKAMADSTIEIKIATTPWNANNEFAASRFRLLFDNPINDQADDTTLNVVVPLEKLNGLQDKLLIAGKTPTEWANLDVGFSLRMRSSSQPIFVFNKTKLGNLGLDFYNRTFIVELKEDCVLDNNFGTVKAFAIYVTTTAGGQTNVCGTDALTLATSSKRTEGPFYYEGVVNGSLQVKMWFETAVIQANGTSDVSINVNQMEGLQNAFYFNGKTLAEWAAESALTITARSGGGFIFRFSTSAFDYSDSYLIEIREAVQTTKGVVQPFSYWVKGGWTFGNFKDGSGNYTGNGYPYGNLGDIGLQNRTEGPFLFEKMTSTVLPIKMWFANSVIQANGSSDVSITVDKMEGLQNALFINGKSLATWAGEGTLTGITARANGGFIFNFALGENKFDYSDNYLFELKNDVMTSKGVVKAFSYWIKAGYTFGNIKSNDGTSYNGNGYPYENLGDIGLQNRTAGPFRFEKTTSTVLPIKMWFANSVIQANGSSDVSITVDKMEGLQNALFINGKSLATWAGEGTLTGITARANGGFIFNFALGENKFDYSKDYTIELTKDVLTSKGVVKTFKWWIKNNYTLGDALSATGEYEGNAFDYNDLPEITIEYNANGGEGTMTGTTLSYGSAYTVLTNLFTKEGFDLLGFSKTLNGTVDYNSDDVLYLYKGQDLETLEDETITLYAVWKEQVEFTLSTATFEIRKDGTTNTLKFMFSNGTSTAPIIATDSGENINLSISKLEGGLENYLSIDGKSLSDWGVLLGNDLTVGNRATQNGVTNGRFAIRFPVSALGNNDFGGKNFVVELSQDVETSQGTVKAFKVVYNMALDQATINPTSDSVNYLSADSFHNMDTFFYFDVKFDKSIFTTAPAIDTPLTGNDLQKTDLSNLVSINGKNVATAMNSVQAVKDSTDTLRFQVLNAELNHNFFFTLKGGYVFPNGNVLENDITLYYNEQNGTWQTNKMPDITIVYDANGGDGTMTGTTLSYGSDYTLLDNVFTRDGYEFLGWSRAAGDKKVVFADKEELHLYVGGALLNVNSAELTLYAVWQAERGVRYISISTAGDIGLNFYVDLDDDIDPTATISLKGDESQVVGVYQASMKLWKFTYGVAAKDYKETVSISVNGVNAEYSVYAYSQALPTTDKAYALVEKLMNYCEDARIYFAGEQAENTDALDADLSSYKGSITGSQDGVTINGATLVLESATEINVYFTTESIDSLVCKVDGVVVNPKEVDNQTGCYVISIKNIVSKDLDRFYTIKIGGYEINYCALSYVEQTLSGTPDVALANVVKSLYALSLEAEKYFA